MRMDARLNSYESSYRFLRVLPDRARFQKPEGRNPNRTIGRFRIDDGGSERFPNPQSAGRHVFSPRRLCYEDGALSKLGDRPRNPSQRTESAHTCRPYRGFATPGGAIPRAHALGYCMPPLRGSFPQLRSRLKNRSRRCPIGVPRSSVSLGPHILCDPKSVQRIRCPLSNVPVLRTSCLGQGPSTRP